MGTLQQFESDGGAIQLLDLLEFAVEQANDGIAIMRFTGDGLVPIRIVYANMKIELLSGFSRDELLDPTNPFLRAQPQNRGRYEALLQRVRAGKSVRFEIALGGKNRSTWTEIRWSPLRYDGGEITHYVAVLREHPAELAREGLCVLETSENNGQHRVVYVNDTMCEMLQTRRERILKDGFPRDIPTHVQLSETPSRTEPGQIVLTGRLATASTFRTFVHHNGRAGGSQIDC